MNDAGKIAERFKRLYVPAVADILDKKGLWNQLLPHEIRPLDDDMKIAGPAFTAKGHATAELDLGIGPRILEEFLPDCVAVWDTSGDMTVGHWGELMSNSAMAKGCVGAVVDGGIRDTGYIRKLGFPVFSRFRCAADAMGRWKITDMNVSVRIGNVVIHPGDYLFGDIDGVVVIPKALTLEVLEKAEAVVAAEDEIRVAVAKGEPLADMYERFKLLDRPLGAAKG
ncbi:MAG: RraA family protein [Rhizobiaceae bacterium]|jgi:regulator of RNase E activity RraA|nr:RraA family protein [Rhizobiaceae bacterium]